MSNSDREKYRQSRPSSVCEVTKWLGGGIMDGGLPYRPGYIQVISRQRVATETHHILGSGNGAKRIDEPTNLIRVCNPVHNWLEEKKLPGLVLCCWIKFRNEEVDFQRLTEIKRKQLPGWFDTDPFHEQCAEIDEVLGYRWLGRKLEELINA